MEQETFEIEISDKLMKKKLNISSVGSIDTLKNDIKYTEYQDISNDNLERAEQSHEPNEQFLNQQSQKLLQEIHNLNSSQDERTGNSDTDLMIQHIFQGKIEVNKNKDVILNNFHLQKNKSSNTINNLKSNNLSKTKDGRLLYQKALEELEKIQSENRIIENILIQQSKQKDSKIKNELIYKLDQSLNTKHPPGRIEGQGKQKQDKKAITKQSDQLSKLQKKQTPKQLSIH